MRPDILLLDEPCSALDPIASGVTEKLTESFRGRFTVVIVTHNLSQSRRIADYAAFFWMKNGTSRQIEHGPNRPIFGAPHDSLTEAYVNGSAG